MEVKVNPFSETDLAKMNHLLQSCSGTECLLDALDQMGIDTTELRNANGGHKHFLTTGKKLFFPDRP